MSEPRHLIEASLRDHADGLEFGAPAVGEIMSRGTRLRRRRAAAITTAAIAVVALIGGVGWGATQQLGGGKGDAPIVSSPSPDPKTSPTSPSSPEPSSPESSSTPTWPPAGVTLTPCSEIPRIAEPGAIDDFTVDREHGILSFSFPTDQGERTVDIAYVRDKDCRAHPDVRQLIERVEGTF